MTVTFWNIGALAPNRSYFRPLAPIARAFSRAGFKVPRARDKVGVMKLRTMCKSKIHHAVVTGADLHYAGSVGIDSALLHLTDIVPGEQVSLWNVNNGQRIETYVIALPEGSGQIVVNGAAARHFQPGDQVIIVAFTVTDEPVVPRMIAVDARNRFKEYLQHVGNEELEDIRVDS
jgi:aspartate 1-decarboxylase